MPSDNEFPSFIYWHERDLTTESDRCFLCGCPLTHLNKSDEHVFPRWLLDRYELRKTRIELLNGSTITYDRMLIPCCRECNNEHLSRIEEKVSTAFSRGLPEVQQIPKDTLFAWIGKIYYGVIFRELTLRSDLRDPNSAAIISPEFLRLYHSHHLLLQHARGVVNWGEGHSPASFLFYRCQDSSNPKLNFDYFDVLNLPFIALRIGKAGIVCCLQDWGRLENYQEDPVLLRAQAAELHPQQFREVAARGAYAVSRIGPVVPHTPIYGPTSVTVMDPLMADFFDNSAYAEHDPAFYAGLLAQALRQPVAELHDGTDTVSLLDDQEGGILRLPWPADKWTNVHL